MRPRKTPIDRPEGTEDFLSVSECVAGLKSIGLDDQEIARLDETLDAIIDHQLDEMLNKYH